MYLKRDMFNSDASLYSRKMTLRQGFAVKILESIGVHLWGFKPNMMQYFVLEYGPVKAVFWFMKNMPKYEKILKTWGPMRTHLVATTLSTLQGCAYCTYGHAYAMQLHYLKQTGVLFPLDEDALFTLHGLPEEIVYKRMTTALTEAGMPEEIFCIDRLAELKRLPENERTLQSENRDDDNSLCHLINMFNVLNSCGIKHQVLPDEAHDPINQDKAIRTRYSELRAL